MGSAPLILPNFLMSWPMDTLAKKRYESALPPGGQARETPCATIRRLDNVRNRAQIVLDGMGSERNGM
jgi:hypothetical protein